MENHWTSVSAITHSFLYKLVKHSILLFLFWTSAVALESCQSKKSSITSKNTTGKTLTEDSAKEISLATNFVNACSERMKGNLREALKLFLECKTIYPENSAVRYELGMVYKLLGLNDLAIQETKVCATAEPKNEWYQLLLIDCYNVSKQNSQAIKVREGLVKNYPERSEFKQDLAYEYAMIGQYDKAIRIYDELEKNFGVNEQLTLNKIKLLKSLHRPNDAEKELQKLIDSDKAEPRYYSYLAEFYVEQNKIEEAKKVYDTLLIMEPNNPGISLALHDYYSLKGNDVVAYEYLKKAFINPEMDVRTKVNILTSYTEQGVKNPTNKTRGIELATIMVKTHPLSPEANAVYGNYLVLDRKTKEAEPYFYLAAIYQKSNFNMWEDLILIDNELDQMDSLEKHSAIALELFPSQAIIYYYNGFANMQLKKYKKAVVSFRDGIGYVIDDKALLLRFYASLGDAYYYTAEYQNSYSSYESALKIDPDNTYVLNNYAYFLSLRKEDLDKAEKLSKRTLDLKPNERNYMDTYGWILFQQKKYPEAEEWLEQAAKLGPNNANILEHYGDALYRNNKAEKALEQWNAAKKLGNPSAVLLEKIKNKNLND